MTQRILAFLLIHRRLLILIANSERVIQGVIFFTDFLLWVVRVEALSDFLCGEFVGVSFDKVLLFDAVPAGAAFFAGAHAFELFGFVVLWASKLAR